MGPGLSFGSQEEKLENRDRNGEVRIRKVISFSTFVYLQILAERHTVTLDQPFHNLQCQTSHYFTKLQLGRNFVMIELLCRAVLKL